MNRVLLIAATLVWTAHAVAQDAPADSVPEPALIQHIPLNESQVGAVALTFAVSAPDRAGSVVVHVLPDADHPQELEVVAQRTAAGYVAQIPAERVTLPAFRYFVSERLADGRERAVFAERNAPHCVRVLRSPEAEAEHVRLVAREGKRSTLLLRGEVVDFGARKYAAGGGKFNDRYYGIEVGYAYAVLTHIEELSLHLLRVRGEASELSAGADSAPTRSQPGIDAGRAGISLLLTESVRLRGSLLFGASQRGFEYGGGGALVLGDPNAVNLAVGADAIRTLGATAHLRLGFSASPSVPMGAAIEVTSFPIGNDAGVRLLYDIGYRFNATSLVTLRAGYQGRSSVAGGAALAATLVYGF